MRNFLITLVAALGLVLVLEGLPYFAAPRVAREVAQWAARRSDATMRRMGLLMIAAGLAILYLVFRGGWHL
jgi:uncharacterized protein YjeT (DUF2065 family)